MTTRGAALVAMLRKIFVELVEIDKSDPGTVDEIVSAIVGHVRAWRPVSVAPLGTLPDPTEPIVDPRTT
jgi:hypothetical protein